MTPHIATVFLFHVGDQFVDQATHLCVDGEKVLKCCNVLHPVIDARKEDCAVAMGWVLMRGVLRVPENFDSGSIADGPGTDVMFTPPTEPIEGPIPMPVEVLPGRPADDVGTDPAYRLTAKGRLVQAVKNQLRKDSLTRGDGEYVAGAIDDVAETAAHALMATDSASDDLTRRLAQNLGHLIAAHEGACRTIREVKSLSEGTKRDPATMPVLTNAKAALAEYRSSVPRASDGAQT